MFAESEVLRKIDAFEQKNGWRPVPNSVADCDRMVRHFDDEENLILKSRTGNIDLRRPLKPSEKRWIANERTLCALDCSYFLTRYYWIQAEAERAGESNIMHFAFRSGQRVFYRTLQRLDAKGKAKQVFCLKARKQGISTLVEGIMAWGALFFPGTRVAIASADGQKSQIMAGMFFYAIDELPWWLESTRTRDKRASDRGIIEWSHIGNQVVLQSGAMKGGIGQGTTPNFCHISEASQFTNAVTQLDEGLLKAVTANPNNVLVIETTGDGDDWTAKMWNECKDNYWEGKTRLLPLFLPWFMTPELYPSASWIGQYPIPRDWIPAPETVAMTHKCEAYVNSTEVLREELGKGWKLPREQQWWWEFEFMSHRRRGIEKSFTRQHPCDDLEALIGENDKAVGEEAVEAMKRTVSDSARIYMVAGEGVETKNEPDRHLILNGEDAHRLYTEWRDHKDNSYEWAFIPMNLLVPDLTDSSSMKKALIWDEPEPDYDYGIGVDTGTGAQQDRSVINVTRKGIDDDEPDTQVAEFADDTINNTDLWAWVAALTSYYARYMTDSTMRHPKLCIELRRKFGDMTFNQLYHGLNFKRHNWFVPLDKTTFRPVPGKQGRPGFWTTAWSRPMLLSFFTSSVENGWYQIRSRFLRDELTKSEMRLMKSGQTRMDHVSGEHNDRIFASALSHWTLHDAECLAEWSKRKFNAHSSAPPKIDYSPYSISVSVGGESLWGRRA